MQLSLFDFNNLTGKGNEIKDIRTSRQLQHKVSYDVGEKIGGAMKDLVKSRFEQSPSLETLWDLENVSSTFAEAIVSKKAIFSRFSLDKEKEKGVDVSIALLKESLLKRVEKKPLVKDSDGRQMFLLACQELLELLDPIKNKEAFELFKEQVGVRIIVEQAGRDRLKERIQNQFQLMEQHKEKAESFERRIKVLKKHLSDYDEWENRKISCLGEKFCAFFTKRNSANQTWKRICQKGQTWNDVLTKRTKVSKGKSKRNTWERTLPENPKRIGGRDITINKPEDLLKVFSFRACEFGHYVDDSAAMEHLQRSAEAFYDLADLLQIKDHAVSLGEELAIAYGSRGRGRALAHYEVTSNVINLTKKRGSLGVLSHEWFHALDRYLFLKYSQTNQLGFVSDSIGSTLPNELREVVEKLDQAIIKGSGVEFFYNSNEPDTKWRISNSLKTLHQIFNGDLEAIVRKYLKDVEERRKFFNNYNPIIGLNKTDIEKKKQSVKRKEKRELKKYINALCWHHEKETGKRVERIAVPSDKSQYFLNALNKDKGKEGEYWSSRSELYARAFETYIQDKLFESNRQSDYLVTGISHTLAYPQGEERVKINQEMDRLMLVLRKSIWNDPK